MHGYGKKVERKIYDNAWKYTVNSTISNSKLNSFHLHRKIQYHVNFPILHKLQLIQIAFVHKKEFYTIGIPT
jgi:hypothetical protein